MPRRHRRAHRPPRRVGDEHRVEDHPDGSWCVRRLTGLTVVKSYRCPGCQQEIPAGAAHILAWPAGSDGAERRHWHSPCWEARNRRHPPGRHR